MTTPASSARSQAAISRAIIVACDPRMLERMQKQSDIRGFTFMCDERELKRLRSITPWIPTIRRTR